MLKKFQRKNKLYDLKWKYFYMTILYELIFHEQYSLLRFRKISNDNGGEKRLKDTLKITNHFVFLFLFIRYCL